MTVFRQHMGATERTLGLCSNGFIKYGKSYRTVQFNTARTLQKKSSCYILYIYVMVYPYVLLGNTKNKKKFSFPDPKIS